MAQEIERKWLVKGFPEGIQPIDAYIIEQLYLISGEEEVRLRRSAPLPGYPGSMSPYKMTFKGPGTYSRKEVEIELVWDQFYTLASAIEGEPIKKEYHKYIVYGYMIEISRVDDNWYYAEAEFNNEDEMKKFEFPWPELIIKEVTYDNFYKMKNYWNRKNANN